MPSARATLRWKTRDPQFALGPRRLRTRVRTTREERSVFRAAWIDWSCRTLVPPNISIEPHRVHDLAQSRLLELLPLSCDYETRVTNFCEGQFSSNAEGPFVSR